MQQNNYDNKKAVWFEIQNGEGETFFQWAKDLGCVWLNGKKIDPKEPPLALHFEVRPNGTLARIPLSAWFDKSGRFNDAERYMFCAFIKGKLISPHEYWKTHAPKN